ncbi:MAG TPA: PepSY domain-containing protein [Defluviitoga sp.]|nr:PepSY domain-containing protein [Defluviitoga sp.]HPZ29347.1 PepSY domain-containing protein [Defluviitoga sp.]
MKKKPTSILCVAVLLISGVLFTQFVDQPSLEVPTIPEEAIELPIDQLFEIVKSLDLGTAIVSVERDKGLFGGKKDSYTFKFENGAEVQINSKTGEVLKSKEGKKQDKEIMQLLSMTGISLEEVVKTVMKTFQEDELQFAELRADEIGSPIYQVVFEDLTVVVDATTGEIIEPPIGIPSLPETEEVPLEQIPPLEEPEEENEISFPEDFNDF